MVSDCWCPPVKSVVSFQNALWNRRSRVVSVFGGGVSYPKRVWDRLGADFWFPDAVKPTAGVCYGGGSRVLSPLAISGVMAGRGLVVACPTDTRSLLFSTYENSFQPTVGGTGSLCWVKPDVRESNWPATSMRVPEHVASAPTDHFPAADTTPG